MNKRILILIFFSIHMLISAQSPYNADSLKKIINTAVADTTKIRAWLRLSECYQDTLPYESISCLEKGFALVQPNTDKHLAASLTNELGHHLFYVGDYEKSSRYFLKTLEYYKTLNYSEGTANCLNNLGSIYIELEDYEKALQYNENALAIFEENYKSGKSDQNQIAMALGNIGRSHYYMNNFVKAKEYYLKSLHLSKITGNKNRISLMMNNIGSIFAEQQKYDSALVYFESCYQLQLELENKPMLITVLNNIAELYQKKQNFPKAIEYYNNGLNHAKSVDFLDGQKVSYGGLHECYLQLKDYENAHNYLLKYTEIKDSIFNENNSEKINEMLTAFDTEKKEQEIQLLQKDKEIRAFWQNALIIGIVLLVLLALLLFWRFREKGKVAKELENKNEAIEAQKRIIDKAYHELSEINKDITDSIRYAKRIQQAVFPHADLMKKLLPDSFVYLKPKDIVSGDFYWIATETIETSNGSQDLVYFAVCDSTGHGVPGAFMSLLNIGFLSEAIKEKKIYDPNEVFNYVRDRLVSGISKENQKDGFDGVLLCINRTSNEITYAAAHNSPLVVSSGKMIKELPSDRMPVGKGERIEQFSLHSFSMNKGDTLYVYTDGYADQFGGPKGKKFKYKQLNELLQEISQHPLSVQAQYLDKRFIEWKGNLEQVDDVCIIGMRL
ncbi:MAG TPA: tetratricopeptide repeat protein [Bacteroidia bacterium]